MPPGVLQNLAFCAKGICSLATLFLVTLLSSCQTNGAPPSSFTPIDEQELNPKILKVSELRIARLMLQVSKSKLISAEDIELYDAIEDFVKVQFPDSIQKSALGFSFRADNSENQKLTDRMQTMLQANLVSEEKEHLGTQALLWFSLETLRAKQTQLSKSCAKRVMQKTWASVQAQRWALSYWALADVAEITASVAKGVATLPTQFQQLQAEQCKQLCSLPGWQVLSKYDPGSLSPKGYENRIFSKLQFQMADQPRPMWLSQMLLNKKINQNKNEFKPEERSTEIVTIDALIKSARKNWESDKLAEAQKEAGLALQLAKELEDEALILEASQVLFGRVGFENRSADEITAQLKALNIEVTPESDSPLFRWIQWRISLLEFGSKNFENSANSFQGLAKVEIGIAEQARAKFWQARSELSNQKASEALQSLAQVGQLDPLSYYDVLAGGLLKPSRPMASTELNSPFSEPAQTVIEKWIPLRFGKPSPVLSREFKVQSNMDDPLVDPDATEMQSQFDNSTASALLLATALRAGLPPLPYDSFVSYLQNHDTAFTRLLRSEALWQKQTQIEHLSDSTPPLQNIIRVSWLLKLLGEYNQAIPYISYFRAKLVDQDEDIAFLYFIYFPKPFLREFKAAAKTCGIETHVAYAIARQESLFQNQVKSSAGAVGIMQLMPAMAKSKDDDLTDLQTSVTLGSCELAHLLKKYKGKLSLAAAAYNAGESKVDGWLKRRQGEGADEIDEVSFIEWIPYSETQNYVKAVVRNYALMNWIYGPELNSR